MAVTPAKHLSLPLSYARASIAASATFQALGGWANEAAALPFVYVTEKPDPTVANLPMAVVDWDDAYTRIADARGAQEEFLADGAILFQLLDKLTGGDSLQDEVYRFMNAAAGVIEDMEALTGQNGYLDFTESTIADGPWKPMLDEKDSRGFDYWVITYRLGFESI